MQGPDYSPAERDEFASWLLRSPDHIGAFLKIARAWGDVGLVGADTPSIEELVSGARQSRKRSNVVVLASRMGSHAPFIREELELPEDEAELDESPELHADAAPPPSSPPRRARWMVVAAAATVLVAAAGMGWFAMNHWLAEPPRIRTAIGEQRSVVLADGSIVQVNTDSDLKLEISPTERRIRLDRGEARFTVAHDSARPFVVITPQATVRALGTVFNVQIAPQGTDVAVLEGHVEVISQVAVTPAVQPASPATIGEAPTTPDSTTRSSGSAEPEQPTTTVLSAGEQAAITPAGEILPNVGPPLERVRGWTERRLVFREETLATLVSEVNRYHERQIRIGDPAIADLRISGTFAAHDLPSLIEYLERYRGVDAREEPDGSQTLLASPPENR
jgi:transmembrane sensor